MVLAYWGEGGRRGGEGGADWTHPSIHLSTHHVSFEYDTNYLLTKVLVTLRLNPSKANASKYGASILHINSDISTLIFVSIAVSGATPKSKNYAQAFLARYHKMLYWIVFRIGARERTAYLKSHSSPIKKKRKKNKEWGEWGWIYIPIYICTLQAWHRYFVYLDRAWTHRCLTRTKNLRKHQKKKRT